MLSPLPSPAAQSPQAIVRAEPLAIQLLRLTDGLLFVSESEAPLQVVQLPIAPGADLLPGLCAQTGCAPGSATNVLPLEDVMADLCSPPEGADAEALRQAPAFQQLRKLLETQLSDAQAIKLGNDKRRFLYLIGRTPDGAWLGVRTEVVET